MPASPATKRVLTLEIASGLKCESCEKVYTDPAECPPLRECICDGCDTAVGGDQ